MRDRRRTSLTAVVKIINWTLIITGTEDAATGVVAMYVLSNNDSDGSG